MLMESDIYIFRNNRLCIIGEWHVGVSLFLALIWKFLSKYGNIKSIFHSDKISAYSKC